MKLKDILDPMLKLAEDAAEAEKTMARRKDPKARFDPMSPKSAAASSQYAQ